MRPSDERATDLAVDQQFQPFVEKLNRQYNFDFRQYKPASLERRIRARMAQVRVGTFEAYTTYLDEHPGEHVSLFNTVLINVTGFFRDADAWKALADDVIPRIATDAAGTRSIRIWSAGCSSGEEPFSVAMLLAEHLGSAVHTYNVRIYGTDIDEDALATARHAVFQHDQLKDVPEPLLDRYFSRDGEIYRLRRDIRRWCIFGNHNLTEGPPLSQINLLVCRNVLIYFTGELQERLLRRFHYAVRHGGFLFLGRAESLLARSPLFTPVHLTWRIFERTPAVSRPLDPTLPESPGDSHAADAGATAPDVAVPMTRAQRALEAVPAAVVVVDTQDTVSTWNPAAEALFGIPISDALGRKFRDLDVSYRVEGLRARIEEVKSRQAVLHMEDATFARRHGGVVHAKITIAPLVEGQRLLGVVVYAADATEQAALRDEISRIAEQHATAIEELQSTNEELETTNEELQSTNEELETTNEELQSTNEELETTVAELQATNSELATLNAELELRTAELRRLDAEHQGLLDSLDQPVFAVDRTLVVRRWNRATGRLWGVPPEYAVGRELFSLPLTRPVANTADQFHEILERGTTVEISGVPYTLPSGDVTTLTLTLLPLRDAAGEVTGVIVTRTSGGTVPGGR